MIDGAFTLTWIICPLGITALPCANTPAPFRKLLCIRLLFRSAYKKKLMIRQEHRTVLIQMVVIILLVLSDVTFAHQWLPRLVNVN